MRLDHVISYYGVSKEVEPTIKESPSNQGLDVFLHALKRLQEAMIFFEKNNPQSVELENVVWSIFCLSFFILTLLSFLFFFQMSLFETGKDNLANEFKELLAKHSQTLSPSYILEAVSVNDGMAYNCFYWLNPI